MLLEYWSPACWPPVGLATWQSASRSSITAVAGVAEDEVTVPIAEVEVTRADLRIDHQRQPAVPGRQHVAAVLIPKVAEEQATFMSNARPLAPR